MATIGGTSVDERFDIVPTSLAVTAMRDSGYKNAAYALAELVDNAIQANATSVKILCAELESFISQRSRRRLHEIAVLDNGHGMSRLVLRSALQFGNGTRLGDRSGIGRFGMGLPNASLSQCRRVDVWTWEDGGEVIHTYLDFDEIRTGELVEIPVPTSSEIPAKWRSAGVDFDRSGTLVVWSKLDRVAWVTARALFENSNLLIGRIYRHFIHRGQATISFAAFLDDKPADHHLAYDAEVNDPLYLMAPSSTPDPYNNEPMFDRWPDPENFERTLDVAIDPPDGGREVHRVTVRFAVAKLGARVGGGRNPGATPYGQHARRNLGVSLVRADREIELDQSLVNPSEPRDRWWGVEVDFPPALDEVFGVTNNKQSARNFAEAMRMDWSDFGDPGQTRRQIKDELREAGDPMYALLELREIIEGNLNSIREVIAVQTKGVDTARRHSGDTAEKRATEAVRRRSAEGHAGTTDQQETSTPPEQREQQIRELLESQGQASQTAIDLAHRVVSEGLRVQFTDAHLDTPAFFSVRSMGGVLVVTLNTRHPVYDHLIEALPASNDNNENPAQLKARLESASEGLRLLLAAWARYEDELEGSSLDRAQNARSDWGSMARVFFDEE